VFLYLLPDALTKHDTLPLYVMGIHLVLALAIFLRIAYSTVVSPARRVFAQFADVAAITWYMTVLRRVGGAALPALHLGDARQRLPLRPALPRRRSSP
jgi:hypothetical protein